MMTEIFTGKPFPDHPMCPKCQGTELEVTYDTNDWLKWECQCGYSWETDCADAKRRNAK